MPSLHRNNATSTLAASIVAGDATLIVQSGHGARFPAPGVGEWFWLAVQSGATMELMRCVCLLYTSPSPRDRG